MMYPRVFFLLCLSVFFVAFGFGMTVPFLPLYAKELGASDAIVGVVVSSFFIMRAFLELPSGLLSDRIGRRIPIAFGLVLGFLGAIVCSLAVEPTILILGRLIWGSGTGFFVGSAWGFLFDLFPLEVRGKALSIYQPIMLSGFTVGPIFGGFAASFLGETNSFLIIGLMMLVSCLIIVLSKELHGGSVKGEIHRISFAPLKNWSFMIICIGAFSRIFLADGIISTILPLHLENLGITVDFIGIIIGVRSIGMMISTTLGRFLVEKIGLTKLLLFGFVIDSVIVFFYSIASSFEGFLSICLVSGIASGIQLVSLTLLLSILVPKEIRGTGIGVYRTFFDLGAVTGPILLTALLSAVGLPHISICFYVGTMIAFSTFIMILTSRKIILKEVKEDEQENGQSVSF